MRVPARYLLPTLLCALPFLCTACFENDDPIDQARAISNVSGTWTGTASDGNTVILDLNQTAVTVTGSARIGSISGSLTGSIDGTRFEATIQSQPIRRIFATAEAETMSGTIRDVSADILSNFDARLQ